MRKNFIFLHLLKILIPAFLTIGLFAIVIFFVILPNVEQSFIDRKKEMTRDLVQAQWHILQYYYDLELYGIRSRQEAQERVLELFRMIRYGEGNKNYFWIDDVNQRLLMHPYRPDLEGLNVMNLSDLKVKKIYNGVLALVQRDCEGYVCYNWHREDERQAEETKLSYVKGFAPWGWIIGTGVFIEDVQKEVQAFAAKIVKFSGVIIGIVGCLLMFLVVQSMVADKQRLMAEQSLFKSYAEYKSLVEHIKLGVFRVDPIGEGRFEKVNTAMARIFGYEASKDLIGIPPLSFYNDAQERAVLVDEITRGDGIANKEIYLRRKDGKCFWAMLTINIVRDQSGGIEFFEGIIEDITERKQLALELDDLLKVVSTKNDELESLIYASSHDLRTPLINIQGFRAEMEKSCQFINRFIDELGIPSPSHEEIESVARHNIPAVLQHIHFSISKIGNLIDSLLIFSQVSSIQHVNDDVDMNALVKRVVEDKNILLDEYDTLVVFDSLPSCKGNFAALKDVFSTLIDNAIFYRHPDNSVRIYIRGEIDGDRVVYCLEDNGNSIDPIDKDAVFNIFYRVQHYDVSAREGFGLTIAKRILERLNGSIRLESDAGQCTRFYISLPIENLSDGC